MPKQLTFEKELHVQLDRFEARLTKLRLFGLKLWTGVLRSVANDLVSARVECEKKVYQELMLLESKVADDPELVAQIGSIKGLLSVLCLGLICWGALDLDFDTLRSMRSRRRRDEEVLIG